MMRKELNFLSPGYMAYSCTHCDAGAIPPLAEYYLQFLDHFRMAPLQLATNTFVILDGLRELFQHGFQREPSVEEVLFLYRIKKTRNPNFFHLESNRTQKTAFTAVLGLK